MLGGGLAGWTICAPHEHFEPDILAVPPTIQLTAPLVLSNKGH
jgi:hypothetical protein